MEKGFDREEEAAGVGLAGLGAVEAAVRTAGVLDWVVARLIAARPAVFAADTVVEDFVLAGVVAEEQLWSFGKRC